MNDNTGAILALSTGGIVFANEWVSTSNINWRVAVATPLAALFMYGVGKISAPLAAGLGGAMLVTGLVTPLNGSSPLGTLSKFANPGSKKNG